MVAYLKSQIPTMCRDFYLQTWIKALNATVMDSTLELRNPKKVFYPLAIRVKSAASPLPSTTVSATPTGVGD